VPLIFIFLEVGFSTVDAPLFEELNPDQKSAVTSRDRLLLVTAGAGSGKTFVIIRKICYLVQECGVRPERVLAITFTRNAAREMRERLRETLKPEVADSGYSARFTVRTFHALCYLILQKHWPLVFSKPFRLVVDRVPGDKQKAAQERQTKSELLKAAVARCLSGRDFRIDFKRYLWDYLLEADEADRFGGRDDPRIPGLTSLAGIRVRSYAERDIANWLYERGLAFHYNQPVSWIKKPLRPDFYIPEADTYLEVWDYTDPGSRSLRREKVNQYRIHGKRLMEVERKELLDFATLEKKFRELLPELHQSDQKAGVKKLLGLDRLENPDTGYPGALNSFISLAEEVLDRLKNHSVNPEELAGRVAREKNRRTRSFYRLFLQVYRSYQEILQEEGALDFNDLILQAVDLLRRNPELRQSYRKRWSHILVDEYQDVNSPQVLLLKELVGPESHLTCVGDDWQSIYGFRGSNVEHIQNFSEEFPGARTVNLRLNYRSGASIVGFSSHAIRRCKRYTDKQLVALNRDLQRIVLYRAGRLYDDGVGYVAARISELIEVGAYGPQDILILYRRSSSFRLLAEALRNQDLRVRHETIHAAKGLEAPCVFLWGLVGGRGGFPSIWRDKGIMRLIMPRDFDLRMDEERRIFYVALTRARQRLYLVTEKNNASEFLQGAPPQYFVRQDQSGEKQEPVTIADSCLGCGKTLLPEWRFCPFCYLGLDEYAEKLT
jgi:DNA helicase IV